MSVESAMKRIAEADDSVTNERNRDDQFDAYEKTLRALEDVDADDDDEGIAVVTEWILEQIESTGERPGSRKVRQRASEFCRKNGYDVSDNSWLGA